MTSPTAPSPGLGEREAVAPTATSLLSAVDAVRRVMHDLPIAYRISDTCPVDDLMHALTTMQVVEEERVTLRTENETLRAERDAAIARAEEAERARDALDEAATNATCIMIDAVAESANLRHEREMLAAKLAQAEGEIATMRGVVEKAATDLAPLVHGICSSCGRTNPPDGCTISDGLGGPGCRDGNRCRWDMPKFEPIVSSVYAALTNPEPPHGD